MSKDVLDYTMEELAAMNEPVIFDGDVEVPDPEIIEGEDDDAEKDDDEITSGSEEGADDEAEGEADSEAGSEAEGKAGSEAEGKAGSEAEGEDDEADGGSETYSKEAYDKVVRQRDAIAREKNEDRKAHAANQVRVDQRLEDIMEAMKATDEGEEEEDLTDMNTAERIEHQNEKILDRLEKLETHNNDEDDVSRARKATTRVQEFAVGSQAEYLKGANIDEATFNARLNAVRGDLYADYIDYGDDDATARNRVAQFELNLITQASKAGNNPAKIMMDRFKRKRLVIPRTKKGVAKPKRDSVEKGNMRRIKAGRKSSPSSSRRSGGASMKLTAEALGNMEPEEFEAVMSKIKGTTKEDQLDTHGYTYVNS